MSLTKILVSLNLRFDDDADERAFVDFFAGQHTRFIQASTILGAALVYVFFLWDQAIDPVNWPKTNFVRGAVVAPIIAVGALAMGSEFGRRRIEFLSALLITIASAGLSYVFLLLEGGFNYGSSGIVLTILFCVSILPMRILFFLAFSVISLALFFALQALSASTRPGMLLVNGLMLLAAVLLGCIAMTWRERTARSEFKVKRELAASEERVHELLESILPREIVSRVQKGENPIADAYGEVSIVFADLVGFTDLSRRISPTHLVEILSELFNYFDDTANRYGLDRIKTIGDAYMAVGGLGRAPQGDHATSAAEFALSLTKIVASISERLGYDVGVRVGLHIGPVIAGVIGTKRPAFDCWGESVNLASRLESTAVPGSVLISESAYWRLKNAFKIRVLDDVNLKGIGPTRVFVLDEKV